MAAAEDRTGSLEGVGVDVGSVHEATRMGLWLPLDPGVSSASLRRFLDDVADMFWRAFDPELVLRLRRAPPRLSLGEPVDDPLRSADRPRTRSCKSPFGWILCGGSEEVEEDRDSVVGGSLPLL